MPEELRVLYVDDEPLLLDIGKIFLERSGDFAVQTAPNAPHAMRLLNEARYDAIISDYQMPEMDGIQFLSEVRSRFGQIPFILFTGKGREDVVIRAINSGADFYLQKGGDPTVQFAELSHKIKSATSRIRAEESLQKSEEKYQDLIEHSNEAILVAQDGMLKLVNQRTVEFTGFTEEELLSMPFLEFIHPDDRAMVKERYEKRQKGEFSPTRYRFCISPKHDSRRWVELNVVAITWERRPATLNFLTDITEQKQAEDALRQSEERYRNVVEDQTEFICRFLPDGTHVFANEAYCRYFGKSRNELIGQQFRPRVPPEDREVASRLIASLTPDHPVGTIDQRIIMPDGSIRWQRWSDRAIFDASGQVIEYQSVGRDITDRKQDEEALVQKNEELHASYEQISVAEEELRQQVDEITSAQKALRASEERYRGLFEGVPVGLYRTTPSGQILDANPALVRLLGYPDRASLVTVNVSALYADPADRDRWLDLTAREGTIPGFEVQFRTYDNTIIWVRDTGIPIRDGSGRVVYYEGNVEDITGRRRAEDALRESEERYRTLVTAVNEAIILQERSGEILTWNRAAEQLFGVGASEVMGHTATSRKWKTIREDGTEFPDAEHPSIRTLATGEPCGNCVMGITSATGKFSWVNINTNPLFLNGEEKPYAVVISFLDITERIQAEQEARKAHEELAASYEQLTATEEELRQTLDQLTCNEQHLRESEVKYRTVFENTGTATIVIEEDTTISLANDEFVALSGFSKTEIEGKMSWTRFVATEDMNRMLDAHRQRRQVNSDAPMHYEFRFVTKTGNIHACYLTIDRIPGTTKSIASLLDITNLKRIEDELRERERVFRTLIGNLPGCVYRCANDPAWTMAFISEGCREITGYAPEDFIGNKTLAFNDIIAPDYQKTLWERWQQQLALHEVFVEEYPIRTKTGETRWVWERGRGIYSDDGQVLYLEGFITDITERKQAEDALRESENLFRSVGDSLLDPVLILSSEGIVYFANRAAKNFVGLPDTSDLRGHSIMTYLDGDSRNRATADLHTICVLGGPMTGEFCVNVPGGNQRWVEACGVRINYKGMDANLVTLRDITERIRFEEQLRGNERRLADIISFLPDATLVIDKDGTVLAWNRAMEEMTGVPADQMIGKGDHEYAIPFYHERRQIAIDLILHDNPETEAKYPVMNRKGTTLVSEIFISHFNKGTGMHLWFTASPLYDAAGNLTGAIESIRDVTGRKVAERALHDAARNWQSTFDSTQDAICLFDAEQRIVMCNRTMREILGAPYGGDLIGRHCWEVVHGTTEPIPGCPYCRMQESLKREQM
ncbi:MAG: PAS domain S-box protein, partial [Methanoregula sp.]|nr:PAS domain S-box protein [Methanoregula sp.]